MGLDLSGPSDLPTQSDWVAAAGPGGIVRIVNLVEELFYVIEQGLILHAVSEVDLAQAGGDSFPVVIINGLAQQGAAM